MSSPSPRSQAHDGNNSSDDNSERQRSIVFAWVIALGLVLLIVLFVNPGWLVPPIEATDDSNTQVEKVDDEGDEKTNDIPDEVQPVYNQTITVIDTTDDDGSGEAVSNDPVTQIDSTPDNVDDEVISTNDEIKTTTTTTVGGGGGSSSHRSNSGSGDGGGNTGGDDADGNTDEDNGGLDGSGSDEGCTVQYWRDHPESWSEPSSPTMSFSSAFGNITLPAGMEDLTLMGALGLEGELVDDLLSEGAAGILNAAHHDIHYFKSEETVKRNVVDGLDPQVVQSEQYTDDNDMQYRIDTLQTENNRGCPLLVNE